MQRRFASRFGAGIWAVVVVVAAGSGVLRAEEEPSRVAMIAEPVPPPRPEPKTVLSFTLVGDTGFNADRQRVDPEGAWRHGTRYPFAEVLERIAPQIHGDLIFANLETVVTARNDIADAGRRFIFRAHPNGVRALAKVGFNLLSTANNHSADYGTEGMLETLRHLDQLASEGLLKAHAGVGRSRDDAGRPRLAEAKGVRVLLSAIGIGGMAPSRPDAVIPRPGQLGYASLEDFEEATRRLAGTDGDYRILSVHYGIERMVQTDSATIRKLRGEAVHGRGIDLVVGHHSHVVAGAEITDGRLILYGLGNFVHHGMQSSAHLGICKDFGLLVRAHVLREGAGRPRVRAVEAVPLMDMHVRVAPMPANQARDRLAVMNHLSGTLDHAASGTRGLRFALSAEGTGVHCEPGAESDPAPIGPLCRSAGEVPTVSASLRYEIVRSCGASVAQPIYSDRPQTDRPTRQNALARVNDGTVDAFRGQ